MASLGKSREARHGREFEDEDGGSQEIVSDKCVANVDSVI